MDYTQNLNLPQFAESDRIHHDDFNDAFDKIDTAMPRIVTGSYTGDGEAERVIALGGQPKAVFVCPESGSMSETATKPYYYYGGLALYNHPTVLTIDAESGRVYTMIEITATGFRVFYQRDGANIYAATNRAGTVYHYIAIC